MNKNSFTKITSTYGSRSNDMKARPRIIRIRIKFRIRKKRLKF